MANLALPLPGARWVPLDNLHLTLFFVGHVNEATKTLIDTTLRHLSGPAFSLTVQGVASFSIKGKVRSLWAGIDPNEDLIDLYTKIETALHSIGHAKDKRPFTPHVTLARLKIMPVARFKTMSAWHVEHFLQRHRLLRIESIPIQSFTLFESILGGKILYRPLYRYPLTLETKERS